MKNWKENLFPTCWSWVRLGDLTTLITKGESIQWQGEQYVDSGIPFIRTVNVTQDGLNLDTVVYVTEASHERMKRSQLQAGDILISIAATLGRCCIVPASAIPANINQDVAIVRIQRNDIDKDYLLRVIDSPIIRLQIERVRQGAGRLHLNLKQLRDLLLPLPPLPEQRRIAAILDKADAVRRKRKEAIALTQELLRSAFLEMFGDPVTNPKGWEVKPLEQVTDLLTGYPFKSQDYVSSDIGIKLCRGANVLPDCVDWEDVCYWKRSETDQFERFKLQVNDVVIALDRPWISSGFKIAVIMPQDLPALLVQRVARIRANQREHQNYLYFLLRHPAFQKHCRPTETTVPHISPTDLKTYPVPVPPFGVIQQFDLLVMKHTDAKRKAISQGEQMEFLFNSLLQRAFRGEL